LQAPKSRRSTGWRKFYTRIWIQGNRRHKTVRPREKPTRPPNSSQFATTPLAARNRGDDHRGPVHRVAAALTDRHPELAGARYLVVVSAADSDELAVVPEPCALTGVQMLGAVRQPRRSRPRHREGRADTPLPEVGEAVAESD